MLMVDSRNINIHQVDLLLGALSVLLSTSWWNFSIDQTKQPLLGALSVLLSASWWNFSIDQTEMLLFWIWCLSIWKMWEFLDYFSVKL
jgi:hypothetical protein